MREKSERIRSNERVVRTIVVNDATGKTSMIVEKRGWIHQVWGAFGDEKTGDVFYEYGFRRVKVTIPLKPHQRLVE